MKNPLDIVEGKRVLISEEIAKCYEVDLKVAELNNLLLMGAIGMEEFRRRKIDLLRSFDFHTSRLYKKLFTIER